MSKENNLEEILAGSDSTEQKILGLVSKIEELKRNGANEEEIKFLEAEKQKLINVSENISAADTAQEGNTMQSGDTRKTDAEKAEQIRAEISNSFEPENNGQALPYKHTNIETGDEGELLEKFTLNLEGTDFNIYIQEIIPKEKKPSLFDRFTGLFKIQVVFKDEIPDNRTWNVDCDGNEKIGEKFPFILGGSFKTEAEAMAKVNTIMKEAKRIEDEYQAQKNGIKNENEEPLVSSGISTTDQAPASKPTVDSTIIPEPTPFRSPEEEKKEQTRKELHNLLNPYEEKREGLRNKLMAISDETIKLTQKINSNKEKIETKDNIIITDEDLEKIRPNQKAFYLDHFGDKPEVMENFIKGDIEELKVMANLAIKYLEGQISPRDLITTPPFRYISKNINDEEAKKYADEEATKFKYILDRINK